MSMIKIKMMIRLKNEICPKVLKFSAERHDMRRGIFMVLAVFPTFYILFALANMAVYFKIALGKAR